MNIVRKPLNQKEIIERLEGDTTYITGIVPISLDCIIECNLDYFLDELSERLIGRSTLMDVNYKCVGVENDGLTLLIEVSGDVSNILEYAEYDEE